MKGNLNCVEFNVDETPLFFPVGGQELFGVLHRPTADSSGLGFVFCHPFGEEKLWSHLVYVSLARDLAALGHTVLRFDHMGHGDSFGEFQDASVATHLRDIEVAICHLQQECVGLREVGLFGVRLGATFAALSAARIGSVSRLVLWDPVINGGRYMQEVLRSNLASQLAMYGKVLQDRNALVESLNRGGRVNVDGYELGRDFYQQISTIDLLSGTSAFKGDALILQVSKPGQPVRDEFQGLRERYRGATLNTCVEEPFWREIKALYSRAEQLTAATLSWLSAAAGPREKAHG